MADAVRPVGLQITVAWSSCKGVRFTASDFFSVTIIAALAAMNVIFPSIETLDAVSGRQDGLQGPFRWTTLCMQVPCNEGVLLYHTLLGTLLLLTKEEAASALTDETLSNELKEKWFLVPEDFDDCTFSDQCREAAQMMTPPKEPGINAFTIFPTTDCNARCFYCFELGRSRMAMTEETAHDAAAYILKVSNGKKLKLRWFGGEPLFNAQAIDTIVQELKAAGRDFTSQMTSNGYLFDEATVQKAVDQWNLKKVQITLDGTEEVYNRTKAFIYQDGGSAYQRVMTAIDLLLQAEVRVSIRLNVDSANAGDLLVLSDCLAGRFGGRKGFSVYAALLFDTCGKKHGFSDAQAELDSITALNEKLTSLGLWRGRFARRQMIQNVCMADNDHAVTILPDGRLGKCEHFTDDHFIGSIYTDEVDQEQIRRFKEQRKPVEACQNCAYYPLCHVLTLCNPSEHCTELQQAVHLDDLRYQILTAYQNARKKGVSGPSPDIEQC